MIRAIIIDDEQKGIDALSLLAARYTPQVRIVATGDEPAKGIKLIEDYRPDIVFLDINMPGMDGFELLGALAWRNFNLIFTTAHQEFAIQALKNNAIDYLLKPIDPEDLQAAIIKVEKTMSDDPGATYNYQHLLNNLSQIDRNRLLISSRTGVDALNRSEITYLESHSNYTEIHLSDSRVIACARTLKDFDNVLCSPGSMFMRVHNSFIVNLQQVTRYLKSYDCIILANDRKVPVAKSRRDEFFRWMGV